MSLLYGFLGIGLPPVVPVLDFGALTVTVTVTEAVIIVIQFNAGQLD